MLVDIKMVPRCSRNAFGSMKADTKEHATIEISSSRNRTPAKISLTLLHELLHLWVLVLKTHGCRWTPRKEHKFIYDIEALVALGLRRALKQKGNFK